MDRTNWLSCTLGRFKSNPPRILLPRDISFEYREHVKNLVRTYEKDDTGNMAAEYVNTGADHFAHSPRAMPTSAWRWHPSTTGGEDIGKVT